MLSIVIPTYNMAPLLREGLTYLAAQQPVPGLEYEVIVAPANPRAVV